MIGFLSGEIIDVADNTVVIYTGGVGYQVLTPVHEIFILGSTVSLWIHHVIKEDASELFGFAVKRDRDMLRKLISVSGVGPRGALSILSACPVDSLISSIQNKQSDVLSKLPGIGKKTAEKICIELHNKLDDLAGARTERPIHQDALDALVQLGYSERVVFQFLQDMAEPQQSVEEIVTLFLRSGRN